MYDISYDGVALSEFGVVSDVRRTLAQRTVELIDVSGRSGAIMGSHNLDASEITMTITVYGEPEEREEKMRGLARLVGGTVTDGALAQLAFGDEGGKYLMASGSCGDIERFVDGAQVELTFTAPDPAMYGNTYTIPIPSGGVVHFEVGGNTWTYPVIEAEAVRDPDSFVWGVRLDDKDYIQVETGSAEACDIVCDCDKRTLTIDRSPALPTLTSDWLRFTPGEHKLENDNGTGSATVTITERWL